MRPAPITSRMSSRSVMRPLNAGLERMLQLAMSTPAGTLFVMYMKPVYVTEYGAL